MHGKGYVLEHDEGVSDGDASQEEVDWAEMEKPAKYYPPASASLSALLFGVKNIQEQSRCRLHLYNCRTIGKI